MQYYETIAALILTPSLEPFAVVVTCCRCVGPTPPFCISHIVADLDILVLLAGNRFVNGNYCCRNANSRFSLYRRALQQDRFAVTITTEPTRASRKSQSDSISANGVEEADIF